MSPVIDLYDENAHQEDGSSLWWYKRVDNKGADINLGEVSCIKVIEGGKGYSSPTDITLDGGGGSGATAEAVINGGRIASVIITNHGSGYSGIPRIQITGTGSGAELEAFISDGWHKGFARLKSDFEFGRDETPVYDEAKRFFMSKKNELKGTLKFTSLQDDYFTEHFLSKEAAKYNWAIFQNAGLSRDNFNKYRYFGSVRIPGIYKSLAPGRAPEMRGMIIINDSEIIVNSDNLPVQGMKGNYTIAGNEGYSVQEEII